MDYISSLSDPLLFTVGFASSATCVSTVVRDTMTRGVRSGTLALAQASLVALLVRRVGGPRSHCSRRVQSLRMAPDASPCLRLPFFATYNAIGIFIVLVARAVVGFSFFTAGDVRGCSAQPITAFSCENMAC